MNKHITKQCNRCHKEKPLEDFPKNANRPHGVHDRCRKCLAEERAGWSEEYREKRKQYGRKYYAQNKAPLREQNAKYRAEHREHLMQLDREKYEQIRIERFNAGLTRVVRKETAELIECARCHEMKPPVGFYRLSKYSSKYMSYCRVCVRESNKKIYHEHQARELSRNVAYRLRTKYGMTQDDLNTMLVQQQNCCLICLREFLCTSTQDRPRVDHDHTTGKVRGLLCDRCNVTLGAVQDSRDLLCKMIIYLEKHGAVPNGA